MTPSEVLTDIRNQINEQSAGFYSDEEIYAYMWNGEKILAETTGCAETTDSTLTTVAAQREYTIPSTVATLLRVEYDSYKLKKIDLTQLDQIEGKTYGGITTSGDPVYYYEFGNKIGLSSIPTAAKTLKLWVIAIPTKLTSTSTAFTIPNRYGDYLTDYCLFRMWAKDQQNDMADRFENRWEKNLSTVESKWKDVKFRDNYIQVKDEDQFEGTEIGIA